MVCKNKYLTRIPEICLTILIGLLLWSPAYSMKLIRFATLAPEGSAWMVTMRALDEEIRRESGGELGFKFYPNMAMGDEKDVIRKIRLGQVNAAGFTGLGLGQIFPEVRILELPYIFNSTEEIDYITEKLNQYFSSGFAEKGFVLLGWADVGWIYFLANKPVAEPKDLKGTKVWMWQGDPLAQAFFAELGKSPISLPITDVHLSIQTGMIDAVYCSPLAALVLQWFTRVKYISDIPFTNSIGAVLIDKRVFDELDPAHQKLLLEKSRYKLKNLLQKTREDNRLSYQQLLKEGLKQVPSNDQQREQMRQIGLRVQDRLAGDLYPEELLNNLRLLLEEYRSETSKNNSIDN